ncbi:uncharacterized protein LOC106459633 [Limulus polyphemus]|uniref:Uncharacterized protein LOC106459633 n=1 Tax=Limulus polyphemus TaxID=6850 RepID=A0ABM1B4L1_LIMPO|nr:uncharacterized protein LOC106459633 [Limulus polyphemus]
MGLKVVIFAVFLLTCLSHLVHTGGVGVSHTYQDSKGNFAYYLHTRDGRMATHFQRGSGGAALIKSAKGFPRPALSQLAIKPSHDTLQPAATTGKGVVPIYPPMNKNRLYVMGYIYVKDFLPRSGTF